jgi:hypothetical protein
MAVACDMCGQQLAPESRFCTMCGSRAPSARNEPAATAAPKAAQAWPAWPAAAPETFAVPPPYPALPDMPPPWEAPGEEGLGFAGLRASPPGLDNVPNLDPLHNRRYIRSLALRLTVFAIVWIAVLTLATILGASNIALGIILPTAATAILVLAWALPLTVMILQWGQPIGDKSAGSEVLKYVGKTVERQALQLDSMRLGKGTVPGTRRRQQSYLQLYQGNTVAYITCFPRGNDPYISWAILIRTPPYRWLYQIASDLGRSSVRQAFRSASTRALIEAIHGCVLAGVDAALAEASTSRHEPRRSARPAALDVLVQIYLADGRQHAEVEKAVTGLMSAFDILPVHREESVAGSWYRRIWGQVEGSAPSLEEIVPKAVRAVEMKTLLSQQAGIDAAQGDALAKLISSLAAENTAVIQMGSMLLVKAKGIVMARNLTQLEMTQLERNPALMRDPDTIIQQLRDAGSPELVHAGQLCSCGSGLTIRECSCTH